MSREQDCIRELYLLLDEITEKARHKDLSLLQVQHGAGPCDMYMGLPPICRIRDAILKRYRDIIDESINGRAVNDKNTD